MDLRSLDKEYWSAEMQKTLFVENTAVFLADYEPSRVLTADGRKYHKPIISKPATGTYVPYQDATVTTLTSSDQELEVDQFKYAFVEVDDTDKKQNFYDAASFAAMAMQKQLNNLIEQHWLSQVTSAFNTIDAGSVGGVPGQNLVLDQSNAVQLFTAAHTKLDMQDAPFAERYAVVGAHTVGVLRQVKGNRESALGDSVLANGIIGPWQGWTVVQNNNLPYSASLELSVNPTAGDTFTIAGVTFTARAVPSVAGEFDIGADAAATRVIMVNAINGSATGKNSATGYFEISSENRFILSEKRKVVAVDNIAGTQIDITGYGDIVVAETFTSGSNVWSGQLQHSVFMLRGAIDLAVQMPASVEVTRKEKGFADYIKSLEMFKAKAFDDGARVLVDVKIDASSWV